jgi:hypothetical protein
VLLRESFSSEKETGSEVRKKSPDVKGNFQSDQNLPLKTLHIIEGIPA